MEELLVIVTAVSLVLGIGMAVFAWRLLRASRGQGASRAAVLESLADGEEFRDDEFAPDLPIDNVEADYIRPRHDALSDAPVSMFPATNERGTPGRRWAALAIVGVVVALAVGTTYTVYGRTTRDGARASGPAAPAATSPVDRPLELLSLRQTVDKDGTFTVTGLVQNPPGAKALSKVIAVVYTFDREGTYIATGRATLDFAALAPGEESPFVVRVPDAGLVGRYRVGFRYEDGGVVAHVDRRGAAPAATTSGGVE